jgi:multidrug efflux system membrane fusion protein
VAAARAADVAEKSIHTCLTTQPAFMLQRVMYPLVLTGTAGRHCAAAALLVLAGGATASAALAQGSPAPQGVPVQVAAATRQDVPVLLRGIGSVQAFTSVLLRARVDGTLDKLFFTEGQDVKAGDPLAQIDPRPYAATYAAALAKRAQDQAALANAQRDLVRYSSLARSDFASRQQVDTQQSAVAQDQAAIQGDDAQIASAKLNLDFTTISSPITGRTGIRLVDPGNLVHATDATGIVTVTQIHPISIIFTLPQDELPQLQDGMAHGTLPVTVFASDDTTKLGEGTLLTIDNQIDQSTGTIKLKATSANPDNRLWPGEFVNAHIQVATLHQALVVPSVAVQNGPSGQYVYLVKPDHTVAQVPVVTGLDTGQIVVVQKGLDDGATVVTQGQSRLQAGSKVDVTPPPKASS